MSQIFAFQSREIRTAVEENQVWFVAKDICRALGLVWKGNEILASIPEAWKGVRSFRTPRGGVQNFLVVIEPAVYKLAFRSNKPEADAFTNWVASEVLPTIRKTGEYKAAPTLKQLAVEKTRQKALPAPSLTVDEARRYWSEALDMNARMCDVANHVINCCDMLLNRSREALAHTREMIKHAPR